MTQPPPPALPLPLSQPLSQPVPLTVNVRSRLREALPAAMRARDKAAVALLRATLAAIDNAEAVPLDGDAPRAGAVEQAPVGVAAAEVARRELTEADVIAVLRAEVAERLDVAAQLDGAVQGRSGLADRAAQLRQEADLLVGFLEGPVTADDVREAVRLAVVTLRQAPDGVWADDPKAGTLEWTCWETVEHLADDLFAYAVQLGPAAPPTDRDVPFVWEARRPGGPANSIHADRQAGADGLLQVLEASGALLTAMVGTTDPAVRAHHVFGLADAEGFAAMGVVETLVHTYDLAAGLGLPWRPPADLAARSLRRLFPDAPDGSEADPWTALLWCTGRIGLPGRDRLTSWRWHAAPMAERVAQQGE